MKIRVVERMETLTRKTFAEWGRSDILMYIATKSIQAKKLTKTEQQFANLCLKTNPDPFRDEIASAVKANGDLFEERDSDKHPYQLIDYIYINKTRIMK